MTTPTPHIANIEDTLDRHRVRLEASLNKLRKALNQWQVYSAEYEGFKEELQPLHAWASRKGMVRHHFIIDKKVALELMESRLRRERDSVGRSWTRQVRGDLRAFVGFALCLFEAKMEWGRLADGTMKRCWRCWVIRSELAEVGVKSWRRLSIGYDVSIPPSATIAGQCGEEKLIDGG